MQGKTPGRGRAVAVAVDGSSAEANASHAFNQRLSRLDAIIARYAVLLVALYWRTYLPSQRASSFGISRYAADRRLILPRPTTASDILKAVLKPPRESVGSSTRPP
ncbi:hypothetical protein GCM10010394_47810 [Streptomyces crystallinus]|uniref:Transposase n=1 Tax=Streptomyces crystallinus TaxID=68191 RepID=A0ABN1GIT8_9ACTN